MARDLPDSVGQEGGCLLGRSTPDDQRAAGKSPPTVGRRVGISLAYQDLVGGYTQLVGRDLGEGGLVALPVPARADRDGHVTRRVHLQVGVIEARCDGHLPQSKGARAVTCTLREAGEAKADQTPLASGLFLAFFPRVEVQRLGALFEGLDVAARI